MSTQNKTFILAVPATNATIVQLLKEIMETCAPDERVTLQFGTCALVCSDPAESREFGTKVTTTEAISVLLDSMST
jgi:hypothetical protein